MIIFLYGDNSYLSKQQLEKIRKKHQQANPDVTDQIILDAKEVSYNEIIRQVKTLPFLSKSRLIILKNLLTQGKKDLQEKILNSLEKVPETTIMVFYEDKSPDKRTKIFKDFKNPSTTLRTKEFKQLDDYSLRHWIKDQFAIYQKQIESQALEKLMIYVGNDLWRLSNEIEKLALLSDQKEVINQKDVEVLVRSKIDSNIFNLVDALSVKDQDNAIKELYKLYKNSVYELVILSMIVRQFRNLIVVKELINLNYKNYQIQKETELHSFVVQKTALQCRNYSINDLEDIYQKILDYDVKIKQGKIDSRLGLEMLINEICFNNEKRKV